MTDDLTRDAELSAALRSALGDAPEHEVDWSALHGRIAARAELPLARLRRDAPAAAPSPTVARRPRWIRRAAPLAAAAGVAAIAFGVTLRSPARPPLTEEERATVNEIVEASLPDLGTYISGEAAQDALLEAAVGASDS